MTTPYTRILAALTAHAPAAGVEALVVDLDAMRADLANAREAVLDEVVCSIGGMYPWLLFAAYPTRDGRADGNEIMAKVLDQIGRLRTPPADPELARLEREVARAAVAHAHARAAVDRHPPGSRNEECEATVIAYSRSAEAKLALIDYINAKREGGTK